MEAFACCNADSKENLEAQPVNDRIAVGQATLNMSEFHGGTLLFFRSATPIFTDQALSSRWYSKIWLKTQQILFLSSRSDFHFQAKPLLRCWCIYRRSSRYWYYRVTFIGTRYVLEVQTAPGEESPPSLPDQAAGHQSSEAQELLCLLEDMSAEYEQVSGFRCWAVWMMGVGVLIGMAMLI